MKNFVIFFLAVIACAISAPFRPISTLVNEHNLLELADQASSLVRRMDWMTQKMGVGDMSFECALCGIAMNEIEGFLLENKSVTEIEQLLQKDLCSHLGGELGAVCDTLVDFIPTIIGKYENRWTVSSICIDLKICQKPFPHFTENEAVPTFVIDLDLPPQQRWTKICSVPKFAAVGKFFISVLESVLPGKGVTLNKIGEALLNFYFPTEYAQEIQGCAAAMGVPQGWAALFNIGYEVSDACTSIVAEDKNGRMYHARSLDFWAGLGFTDGLKNMTFIAQFQKGGKTLFHGTTFAGYVGLLSGMKPGAFSITEDTRFYPGGIGELFYEIIAAIEERNASLVSFLARDTFMNQPNFSSALNALANTELIADVYYIMAGVSKNQGVVISRNRLNASNIWQLDQDAGRWFEVETNYDHWKPAPWFDDRRDPANKAMIAMGANSVSLDGMFKVLSTKPVLNIQTTYSILTSAATGNYTCYTRWCPYPCTE